MANLKKRHIPKRKVLAEYEATSKAVRYSYLLKLLEARLFIVMHVAYLGILPQYWARIISFTYEQHGNGLVQNCSISIPNALELLQSYTKPSMYSYKVWIMSA